MRRRFRTKRANRVQNPTARWVFHYFVGIHLLCHPGQWPLVLNLTEEHQHLLRTPRQSLCVVVSLNIHQNRAPQSECRIRVALRQLLHCPWFGEDFASTAWNVR